jgi:hypothetical protein
MIDRRFFSLNALEEDLTLLNTRGEKRNLGEETFNLNEDDNIEDTDLDLENENEDESEDFDDEFDLDEGLLKKLTAIGKKRKKGRHKKGFHRVMKGGKVFFKKVTAKMKALAKKYWKKASSKIKAKIARKKLKRRGFGENTAMDHLNNSISLLEQIHDPQGTHEEYVEFLDGARYLALTLIESFEEYEEHEALEELIDELMTTGAMAESALENIHDEELTEDMSLELDFGVHIITQVLSEAVNVHKSIQEDLEEGENDEIELPEVFLGDDE